MQTKHRSGVAPRPLWPIAAAALATLAAGIFLLHAPNGHAAPAGRTVVSTAKTEPRTGSRQLARTDALLVREGPERQERVLRQCATVLAAADRERQAARGGRREGVTDRDDQACRRAAAR